MQLAIGEQYSKIQAGMERGKYSSKINSQIKPVIAEIEAGNTTLDSLMSKGDYYKANALAKEIQTKLYKTELIIAGKKATP